MNGAPLILVSALWQVDELGAVPKGTVVALDAEVEEALAARGIPFVSAKGYRTPDLGFRDAAYAWTKEVLENPQHPFIAYRGVPLGRVYFYPLYLYFIRVAYWLDILVSLMERHPGVEKLVVYPSAFQATETIGVLGQEEIDALVDSARCAGAERSIVVEVPPLPPGVRDSRVLFTAKRRLFGCLLGAWNMLMRLRRSRPLTILASDYWRNLAPLTPHLPGLELVFIDRLQAFQAGMRNMWRWRMRFYHLDAFSGREAQAARGDGTPLLTARFRGYEVSAILQGAHTALMRAYLPKTVRDIDHAYVMLERLRPRLVVLRASTSPQTHFAILASVSRALRIPSVEFQHGLEYTGEDSFTLRKNAQHLGVYGPLLKKELVSAGIPHERIESIGSPRFDVYRETRSIRENRGERHAPGVLSVLCIYPDFSYGDDSDSYEIDTYMRGVAEALTSVQGARLTVKLRGARREAFFRRRIAELCKGIPHTVIRDSPLSALFAHSDIVVSCYSTAMIEAMLSGVPLVFFAATPLHRRFAERLAPYMSAGAFALAHSEEELARALRALTSASERRAQVERADRFMTEHYACDGQSAARAAGLIGSLAQSTDVRYRTWYA